MTVLAPPASPYKGLSAFDDDELDALLFFGRERERAVIVANLLAARLTVLYGETGVGKSSILSAGVARELRAVAPSALVVVHDTWADDPAAALAGLEDVTEAYVILDQFEEYFVYHDHASGPGTLLDALPDLLRRRPRVNVLISLREDTLGRLDAFKAGLPNVFANQLRLDRLDRDAARSAIVGPVARWNELAGGEIEVEADLVEAVLDQVTTGRVDVGQSGVGSVGNGRADARIEAPYLQLVMDRIWSEERVQGSPALRLETLEALGGAETIVREHVDSALAGLDAVQKDVAARMFDHLVTPSGTKIAQRARDLAQYAAAPQQALASVLATLNRERILRTVDGGRDDGERYEIFHDVLAEPVLAWRARRELERERAEAARRHRRLVAVAVASVAAFAVVAVVAVFALAQRSDARAQARHAHAGELAATALATLARDPLRSLQLALSAARLERNSRIEDVLRTALIGSRVRLIFPAGAPVRAAGLSGDGRRAIVAGGHDATVYDVGTGRRELRLHVPGAVTAASFSPDGRRVLVADSDGRVLVRAVTGPQAPLVLRQRDAVRAAVFGPGARVIAAGGDGGAARLWDARTGKLVQVLALGRPITQIALTRDGRRLAALAAGGRAALYDTATGRLVRAPFDGVTAIAFSPDGTLLATGSPEPRARLWRTSDGAFVAVFPHGGAVTDVGFSPDGRRLLTSSDDGALRVWDLAARARLLLIPTGTNLERAHYSQDGTLIVGAGSDGDAHVWSAMNGRELVLLAGHRDALRDATFGPGGRTVLTASVDGSARLWDVGPTNRARPLHRITGPVLAVGFAAGARRAVAAGHGSATVSDVATGRLAVTVHPAGRPLALSSDGALLLTAGDDGARLVEFATRRVVRTLPAGRRIAAAAFTRDGTRIATTTRSGLVKIWDRKGALLRTIATRTPAVAAALAPDGSLVATAGSDGAARIWSTRTGRLQHTLRIRGGGLADVEFSGDGRFIAAAGEREARLWIVATGELVHVLRGHTGRVLDVTFSPDDRWLLTAGPRAIGVWRAPTGRFVFYLQGGRARVERAAFAPDGEHVVAGFADGTSRIYDCAVCGTVYKLAGLARARLTKVASELTPLERRRYLGG